MNEQKKTLDEDLIPIEKFYSDAEEINFSRRTLQWYVTEGLLPKPVHIGKEAYYKLSDCPIYDYLSVIRILKDDCRFSLGKIRTVLENYTKKRGDIETLNNALITLSESYPTLSQFRDFPTPKRETHRHAVNYNIAKGVRERFYNEIIAGKNINEIRITDIEESVRANLIPKGDDW